MRLIDAEALKEHLSGRYMNELYPDWFQLPLDVREKIGLLGSTFKQAILNAPTIDAEPVVRCKDCKHRYTNACPVREFALEFRDEEHGYQNINFQIKEITHDCGFCYRGEKRDGGADNANYRLRAKRQRGQILSWQ